MDAFGISNDAFEEGKQVLKAKRLLELLVNFVIVVLAQLVKTLLALSVDVAALCTQKLVSLLLLSGLLHVLLIHLVLYSLVHLCKVGQRVRKVVMTISRAVKQFLL